MIIGNNLDLPGYAHRIRIGNGIVTSQLWYVSGEKYTRFNHADNNSVERAEQYMESLHNSQVTVVHPLE